MIKIVPAWCWWLLALLLVGGGQQIRVVELQGDVAREQTAFSDHIAADEIARATAEEKERDEEKRRQLVVEEVESEARGRIDGARADADRAGDALDRLQQRYNSLAATSRACGNAITAQLGKAADNTARVQADVFRRTGEAARFYAAVADERGIAGQACEQSYDGVRNGRVMTASSP